MVRIKLGFVAAASALCLLAAMIPCFAGSLRTFHFKSAALGRDETAQVYVPSGEAPDEGWPVLYLLHGLRGAPEDWNTLGAIGATLDRLIGSKRIQPLLVVMPNGGSSWYVDSAAVKGPGDYDTALSQELPAAVEDAFPVGTDRQHRAIGGISMGGYGALRFAFAAPDRFAAVVALSPALWQNIPMPPPDAAAGTPHDRAPSAPYFQHLDPDTVTIGVDLPPDGRHFGSAFGDPFDPRRFNDANVFTLLQADVEAHRKLPAIYVSVGDDDSHRLWRGSIAFFETMQANNLPIEFRITNGDHNWTLWKASIADALIFADSHLGHPAVR